MLGALGAKKMETNPDLGGRVGFLHVFAIKS
jgi:hypothetical protein